MTTKDYNELTNFYTGKTSDIVFYLSILGIGIGYLFKTPIELFLIALGFHFLQYFIQGVIWYVYFRIKEIQYEPDVQLGRHSIFLTLPAWICFYAKCFFLMLGLISIL